MTEACLAGALREAVDKVLETMFFLQGEAPAVEGRPPEELVAASVDFEGSPSGTLGLRISLSAAQGMAADFLGREAGQVSTACATEVVCELANMICGSVLSRVESETTFRLSPPVAVTEVGDVFPIPGDPDAYAMELPEGAMSIRIRQQDMAS